MKLFAPLDLVPALLSGLGVTVAVTAGALALAFAAALSAGLGRISRHWVLRKLAGVYIEVFRGTSALVQLYWFYFALPLLGVDLNAFTVGVAVLGLNTGAYGAEVVRCAIEAVPAGQWEAARALNFTRLQTLRRVIVPQAVPTMLPPAGNLAIELLKNSALVSTITLADLTFQGQTLRAATLRSGEILTLVLLGYFAVALLMTSGFKRLERRFAYLEGRGRDCRV